MVDERPSKEDLARLSCAWDWVLRLRRESPSQDELNQWLIWYESDERNKQAFDQARAIASQASEAVDRRRALPLSSWQQEPEASARSGTHRRRVWIGAAIAAGLGALAVQFGLPLQQPMQMPLSGSTISAESAAEQKLKETFLPDGSRVELASKSAVQLQYDDKTRLLNMSDGVAYFTVAHNHERPFIVRAGDFYVRAIGTAFNVRHSGERVVVTVAEGTVDVYPVERQSEPSAPPPPNALRVKAGKEVVWADPSTKPDVTTVDPAHALAWREGRLEYLNEPLASAIADINRYSSRKIVIRDPAIGRLVFSGAVLTDSADVWVQSVPSLFPVDLRTDADGNIVLVLRKAASG
jgi:transmembrane sensor